MKTKVVIDPTSLPVTLEETKTHLKILHADEDSDITIKLKTAIEKAEERTNRQLGIATREGYLDQFCSLVKLSMPPLVSITKIEYKATDDTTKTLDTSSYYVDDKIDPAVLYFKSTPTDAKTDGVNNVTITYECGYSNIPNGIKSWILLYAATLYEHRENLVDGTVVSDRKAEYFDHLLDSHRVRPL